MDDKDIKRLEELKKDSAKSSNMVLKESFQLLSIKELGNIKFVFVFVLSIVFSLVISIRIDAALLLNEVACNLETVVLTIFAIAFTAHSIFQAFLSPSLTYQMIRMDDNENPEISSFSGSNSYYIKYMMLTFVMVIVNVFIVVINVIIPDNWNLFESKIINDILFFILCVPYFYCSIGWLIEMKSLITNIFNMYNVAALEKYIDELKKKNNL